MAEVGPVAWKSAARSYPRLTCRAVSEAVPKSTTGQSTHQIYTVVAGDNLTKIAKKFYGTDDYEPIYEANKDRMKSPGDLRVGQTLLIPNK